MYGFNAGLNTLISTSNIFMIGRRLLYLITWYYCRQLLTDI